MTDYPVGSITHNGVTVPVTVDDRGWFQADHGGRGYSYETWAKLDDALKRATRQTTARVAVPFVQVISKGTDGIKWRRGTATGKHGSNGNILVTWETKHGPVKEQLSRADFMLIFGDVSADVLSQFNQLVKDAAQADRLRDEFQRKHKIDIAEVVTDAIDAASIELHRPAPRSVRREG